MYWQGADHTHHRYGPADEGPQQLAKGVPHACIARWAQWLALCPGAKLTQSSKVKICPLPNGASQAAIPHPYFIYENFQIGYNKLIRKK